MLATFIIFFREILEIALIISVIMAATRGIAGRSLWVGVGITGGVVGSGIIAAFASELSNLMEGMGQEVFYGTILTLAAGMIGWTVIWMQKHGRELSTRLKDVGQSVRAGDTPLYAVAIIVAFSMLREGAEIVLFMVGILSATKEPMLAIVAGGTGGALLAICVGILLYMGIIRLSLGRVFSVTGLLLLFVASGLAAQAAGFFIAADLIPAWIAPVWDSSWLLEEDSIVGLVLHTLLGYIARPSAMQLLWYVATASIIATIMLHQNSRQGTWQAYAKPVTAALSILSGLGITGLFISAANAAPL